MRDPWTTRQQKSVVRQDVAKAIGQICDCWPDAIAASQARGYPTGPCEGGGIGSHGDPVPHYALQPDVAAAWLNRARIQLGVVMVTTSGHNSRVGPFWPPQLRQSLIQGAYDLVELWPRNCLGLFHRLYDLADQGMAEWPATPRKGMKIAGVIVGKKAITSETCAGCGEQAFGGAGDPIVRINGKPYHRSPCYMRATRTLALSREIQP